MQYNSLSLPLISEILFLSFPDFHVLVFTTSVFCTYIVYIQEACFNILFCVFEIMFYYLLIFILKSSMYALLISGYYTILPACGRGFFSFSFYCIFLPSLCEQVNERWTFTPFFKRLGRRAKDSKR